MSSLHLPDKPTLADLQAYIRQMVRERGFDKNTIYQEFTLFLEECGELAKAARQQTKMHIDPNSKSSRADHEAADVLMYLLEICNRLDIDLEKAFREKEEENKKRTWSAPSVPTQK